MKLLNKICSVQSTCVLKCIFVAERTHVLKYLVEVQKCMQGSLAFQQTKFSEKKNSKKQFEIKLVNKPKKLVLKSLVMPTTRQRNSEREGNEEEKIVGIGRKEDMP